MSIERLFEIGQIGGLTLTNRLVRSATSEMMAPPRARSPISLSTSIVISPAAAPGLMFTGMLYPHPRGRYISKQAGIHDDAMVPALARLTSEVHDAGGIIFGEIGHAGSQSRDPAVIPLAPSPVENFISLREPQAADGTEIVEVINAFADGARRLREAGL